MADNLPPCGLYRTTRPIGAVPEGRLVYFHNHGDPGPGIYPPESWRTNRAVFSSRGITLPDLADAGALEPVPAEGLYRVMEEFTCCDKNCRTFPGGRLVQLGYNGSAEPILFEPYWTDSGLHFPNRGQRIDQGRVQKLEAVSLVRPRSPEPVPPADAVH